MIGIDEVGRGCWAGPLLVVALRPTKSLPLGLQDSKTLRKSTREELAELLPHVADIGEGWVQPEEIDSLGLTHAIKLGVERALNAINATAQEEIIMDGDINYCAPLFRDVQCVIKADATYPAVSAASIWAKVARDKYMIDQARSYPEYGFEKHVGYGTSKHIVALKTFGVTRLHRLSYKPVRKINESRE